MTEQFCLDDLCITVITVRVMEIFNTYLDFIFQISLTAALN